MSEQSFASHRQFVPSFHYFLTGLLLVVTVTAIILVVRAIGSGDGLLEALTILGMVVALHTIALLARSFALRAQDRVIHAQENFRHYLATGKPMDPRITVRQAVGVRFASDDEFVELVKNAAETGMSEQEIKKSIKNWRADNYRV